MPSASPPPDVGAGALRVGVVAAAILAATAAAPAAAMAQDQDVVDTFARRMAADVSADGIGGISAAVFRGDQVLWAQGFGWADPKRQLPAGVRTIYRTGSISKSITAVLLADLFEDDVLQLDGPVVAVLPEVAEFRDAPASGEPVTFRQLASHTAGLIREPELQGAAAGPIEDWGHKILLSIPHTRYFTAPGTEYSYSNIGYGVLGYALQRVMGVPFIELIQTRIFDPLGMRSSTFIIEPELSRRLATGFANRSAADGEASQSDAELPAREHRGRGYKVPNGGVYSTVSDLATLAAAVMGRSEHELLLPATRAQMMRAQTPASSGEAYGLGFAIDEVTLADGSIVTFVGHGGSVAGYTAYLVFEPDSGYGTVLLRNYNSGATNLAESGNALLAALLEALANG